MIYDALESHVNFEEHWYENYAKILPVENVDSRNLNRQIK